MVNDLCWLFSKCFALDGPFKPQASMVGQVWGLSNLTLRNSSTEKLSEAVQGQAVAERSDPDDGFLPTTLSLSQPTWPRAPHVKYVLTFHVRKKKRKRDSKDKLEHWKLNYISLSIRSNRKYLDHDLYVLLT